MRISVRLYGNRSNDFMMQSRSRSLCYLLSLLLIPGCSFIRDPTWIPSTPDEFGIIGILENAVTPNIHVPAPIRDYGAGMAVGAVTGMFAWNATANTPTETTEDKTASACKDANGLGETVGCAILTPLIGAIVGAVTFLAMTLVAGGVGALWGGAKTAAGYGPQPDPVAEAQSTIEEATRDYRLQSRFVAHLQSMIDARSPIPSTLYYQPGYHTLTAEGIFTKADDISTVFQTWIESINFRQLTEDENPYYSLIVHVRANTYRRNKSRPVDVHHFEWEGAEYPVEMWGENAAGLLRAEIQKSYQEIGEQIVARLGFREEHRDQAPPVSDAAEVP